MEVQKQTLTPTPTLTLTPMPLLQRSTTAVAVVGQLAKGNLVTQVLLAGLASLVTEVNQV